MLKKITAGVLAAMCMTVAGGSMITNTANAAISTKTYSTNEKQKNDITYLKRHTNLSEKQLTEMLSQGDKKEDIQNVYVLRSFLTDSDDRKYDNLFKKYKEADKNIDTMIETFHINKEDFTKVYERTFPEGENTDFDRAQRIKNLRYMEF